MSYVGIVFPNSVQFLLLNGEHFVLLEGYFKALHLLLKLCNNR